MCGWQIPIMTNIINRHLIWYISEIINEIILQKLTFKMELFINSLEVLNELLEVTVLVVTAVFIPSSNSTITGVDEYFKSPSTTTLDSELPTSSKVPGASVYLKSPDAATVTSDSVSRLHTEITLLL